MDELYVFILFITISMVVVGIELYDQRRNP